MPFQSEKQRRYMWANEPEIAQKWSDKYGSKPLHEEDKKAAKKSHPSMEALKKHRDSQDDK